jgi:hypothetical protein
MRKKELKCLKITSLKEKYRRKSQKKREKYRRNENKGVSQN